MTKRIQSDDEEEHSGQGSASEGSPPPAKKAKKSTEKKSGKKSGKSKSVPKESSPSESTSKKGNIARNVFTNSEDEKFIDLGKKRRATVRNFKGAILVDIREFYGKDDDLQPGKKGISLSVEQWEELKANSDTIDNLIQKLKTS